MPRADPPEPTSPCPLHLAFVMVANPNQNVDDAFLLAVAGQADDAAAEDAADPNDPPYELPRMNSQLAALGGEEDDVELLEPQQKPRTGKDIAKDLANAIEEKNELVVAVRQAQAYLIEYKAALLKEEGAADAGAAADADAADKSAADKSKNKAKSKSKSKADAAGLTFGEPKDPKKLAELLTDIEGYKKGIGELYEDGPLAPDYELSKALTALAQIVMSVPKNAKLEDLKKKLEEEKEVIDARELEAHLEKERVKFLQSRKRLSGAGAGASPPPAKRGRPRNPDAPHSRYKDMRTS